MKKMTEKGIRSLNDTLLIQTALLRRSPGDLKLLKQESLKESVGTKKMKIKKLKA